MSGVQEWRASYRASPAGCAIADRHYNRQKIGSSQFVPPGRCVVLIRSDALWTTSWPFPEYVKHAWPGAWINSLFRKEGPGTASAMIRQAIAATRYVWEPPALGMVTFIDRTKTRPTMVRGMPVFGWTYRKAGFVDAGETKGGLLALQLWPTDMPEPAAAIGMQQAMFAA